MKIYRYPDASEWPELLKRPSKEAAQLNAVVDGVLDDVRRRGDDAVREYEAKFDHVELDELLVSEAEMQEAESLVDDELKAAIEHAHANIYTFHAQQMFYSEKVVVEPGVKLRNVSDVAVRNFTVTSKRPLRFVGNADTPVKDIVLENVAVTTPEAVVPWEAVATEPLVFRNCTFNGKSLNDQKLVTPRGDRQPLIRSTSSWEAKH